MLVLVLSVLFILTLAWGALQMSRLRAEDERYWPYVTLPAGGASLRLHSGWPVEREQDALLVRTGVPRATLRISHEPRQDGAAGSLASRIEAFRFKERVEMDDPTLEEFGAGNRRGARIASAGTLPEGERGWFEFHLIEGDSGDLVLRYRCPVLSGSIDGRTLSRCAQSARFDEALPTASSSPDQSETFRASGQ